MPLFEVAIIKPKTDDAPEELIMDVTCVLAPDRDVAIAQAVKEAELEDNLTSAQVLVRPFVPTK